MRPSIRLPLAAVLLAALPLLCAAADEPVPADKAILVIRLPAGATLTIGDHVAKQTGAERVFITPPLAAGKTYAYDLKATWQENGKEKTVTREVIVPLGKRTVIDLNTEPATKGDKPSTDKPADKPEGKPATDKPTAAKQRTFLFTYSGKVTDLKPGDKARVWLPVPPTNDDQEIKLEAQQLPVVPQQDKDPQYGNKVLYFAAAADDKGEIPFSRTYRVTRREVKGADKDKADDALVPRFLEPDKLVPIEGKPLALLQGKALPKDPTEAAKVMYDVVDGHMKYDKSGDGWGRGDAVWACDNKRGNCTDFHSLFISLARANKIPAKFEIGFGIPEKHGEGEVTGYHCWAKFRAEGQGWVPVDISEANKHPEMKEYYFGNLTADRVAFSTGRDITLVPKQDGDPLNFFVYPYVEVDKKPYDKVTKKFTYKDVE
jgi:uncharacterized protein (TIGR03000 family)